MNEDYEKILILFQSEQFILAQQLIRRNVDSFADWLADKMIIEVKTYHIDAKLFTNSKISYVFRFNSGSNSSYIKLYANASYCRLLCYAEDKHNAYKFLYNKIGRISKLMNLKQYNKVKQKLKGVLKTLLLSAIHGKLN